MEDHLEQITCMLMDSIYSSEASRSTPHKCHTFSAKINSKTPHQQTTVRPK